AAALYGALIALIFSLWPLSWLREVRPAQLFRGERAPEDGLPRPSALAVLLLLVLGFGAAVTLLSGAPELALWVIGAIGAALVALRAAGWALGRLARRLSHASLARRRPALRLALGAIGGPQSDTANTVMALGLGLGVLAAIGQIDANMQRLIRSELPADSPAFFFVDIQPDQLGTFRATLDAVEGVSRVETAPMLRGMVTALDGRPAGEVAEGSEGAWIVRGDRGLTYADRPPEGAELVAGDWWPEDYDGEPLMSFIAEEGLQLGLGVGSTVTVSVLGRPITARIANLRRVDWRGLGINFVMVLNEAALAGAPHTHIATVHAAPGAEAAVLDAVGEALPNVTGIGVRDQVERVAGALERLGAATRWGALAVLATGLAVLVGAAGAAAERQVHEAAVLKVLGASRARILGSFALRAGLLGAGAGLVALLWGLLAAWAVTVFVLDADFRVAPLSAVAVVAAGAALNLLAGLAFSSRPLRLRPAAVFRAAEG
ncbi:MAG TPA: FtsX-like permease family protein, partial [Thermohalobaculum sp.]|nr:FtsX-like permease family protein [Thermohalobaculum sp.]